ncbi:MAG: CHASE3 domain-containing protein [Aulosira sp. ZfuVER01]|nr:CHASE3 domain-containing protein [Aulosira sp. ZfuVER01]MDZ8000032.1 CHASE3 domain-containing protein [Aulosira sp. DedVER01a]MDZ8051472.1 CHASE3 domain-containing protein [Aulosira sp. ZfuCHP01]
MKKLTEKFVVGGFGLALLLLSSVGAASYWSVQKLKEDKQWVTHTNQILNILDHLNQGFLNAESGQRGFMLTGKADYLKNYGANKRQVYQAFQELRQLTSDNSNQQRRLAILKPLIDRRFHLLEELINLLKQNSSNRASLIVITEQNYAVSKEFQVISQVIKDEEIILLRQRTALTNYRVHQIIIVISVGYGLSFTLLIGVYLLLQKQIRINQQLSQEAIHLEKQAAKAKLANILETVSDAFIALDCNWCYTYVNERAGQIFNRVPTELIGKNIWQEFPEGVGQKFYHAYYQAVAEQKIIEIEEYYPPWDRWFENRIYPSKEGLSIFFQDITRRKLAEITLEKSEKRYRSLVIATAQAVWIADANGLPKEFSSWRSLTGQSEEEVMGWGWLDAIHPEDRQLTESIWNQAFTQKNIYKLEHRVRVADGSYRFFAVRAIPVLDANEQIMEWVGTHTDITETKLADEALQQAKAELEIKVEERTAELHRLNEDLKRSNQELEQFAYVASHDLQEPLRAVAGYSQLLGEEYQEYLDESAREYLTYIVDGATRMRQLIQDLLAFSRVGTRGQAFVPTDCNLVLKQALNNLQVAIAESKAIITHDPLPTVLADKTQLVQLFQNLIGNAIKFRQGESPQIHIGVIKGAENFESELESDKVAQQEDQFLNPKSVLESYDRQLPAIRLSATSQNLKSNECLFWVQDNGIGIKPQYLERIFEVFRRLHTRREFAGTGIGLAICKKIVERHGSRIWAESQLGVGTIFYFTLNKN